MQELSIIQRALEHGERQAFAGESNGCTYRQLVDGSGTLAAALLGGAADLEEKRVASLVPAGPDYVKTQWGIWRAGGIVVPISLSATEAELKDALGDADVSTVVATAETVGKVNDLAERMGIKMVRVDQLDVAGCHDLPEIAPERAAMILFTSGTTSRPKGVVTTHACIRSQIESLVEAWRWEREDRIPLFLPLHHIHGIINVMSCALWSGARIEAFPRFDLDNILERVAGRAYTVFMAVPTIYVNLIAALETLPQETRTAVIGGFGDMRLMVSGSAALPSSVHQAWTEWTGQRLLERYGMTEIGMALSNPYEGERRPGAVGQPLPGVEVRLQSKTGERITGEGESGEIQVRGPGVFREYFRRPDATEDSFLDGWFRTGDIAVLESGYFRILGRSSVDIIKSGGYKLSALEIEAFLLDHPRITQCAVVGVPDQKWGEMVAVAVVVAPGETLTIEALRSWCKERVSHYKIPRQLLVVDSLPRNAMGKVTKPAVRDLFHSPQ